nr:hypothetical protein [Gammaproteobacteria bacterium]
MSTGKTLTIWSFIPLVILLVTGLPSGALAQSVESNTAATATGKQTTRLESLHLSITTKQQQLSELRTSLADAPTTDLQAAVDKLADEIDSLTRTFDQLAAGGIELVELAPEGEEFDWRQELIL